MTENAGLENAWPSYRWVENARPVAIERRWCQCCKTEMDVVGRCRKHTRTGNNFICCNKFIQEKMHVADTERVKKPTQNQNASKVSKKHTILWKLQTQCILYHTKLLPTYTKLIVTRTTKHIRKLPSCSTQKITDHSTQRNVKVKKTQDHLNVYAADGTTTILTFCWSVTL